MADDLKLEVRDYMKRNFGIKKASFKLLMIADADGNYRQFLRDHRLNIDVLLAKVVSSIRAANSIYPKNIKEYELRRTEQTNTICNCEKIWAELQSIIEYFKKVENDVPGFHIDANSPRGCIKSLESLIKLVKDWRQSDVRYEKIFRTG